MLLQDRGEPGTACAAQPHPGPPSPQALKDFLLQNEANKAIRQEVSDVPTCQV